jgi:hypothetical protein
MVYRYGTGVEQARIETARADSLARLLNLSPLKQESPPPGEKR